MMPFPLKKAYLLFLFNSIALLGATQTYTYEGIILDAETSMPVPFVHCSVLNSSMGFVTDLNGEFKYESDQKELEIVISSIGFSTKNTQLFTKKKHTILLEPNTLTISEVVVTYVDRERELLQKVKDNISNNYPQNTERLTGKIIEQLATDSSYQDLFYTATSTVEADKLTYENKNVFSTTKILDGEVEYFKSMDSSFVKIYAGIHNLHRFDVIAARLEPFDNVNNKSYNFKLVDTLIHNNQALFKVQFKTTQYEGFLYVQDSTFALIKAEYKGLPEKMNTLKFLRKRLFLHFTIEYFKEKERFRIGYVNYQTGFAAGQKPDADRLYLNNFFYLNEAKSTQKLIPFNEQTGYTAIFIDELEPKKTMLTDSTNSLSAATNQSFDKGLLTLLKNFSVAYEFGVLDHQFSTNTIQNTALSVDASFPANSRNSMIYQSIGYAFSNVFHLVYYNGSSFKRNDIRSHSLLARYIRPITKNQRFLIGGHLGVNYLKTNLDMSENLPTSGGAWQEQVFSQGALNLVEKTTQINMMTGLQFKYRISPRFYLTLTGDVPFSLRKKEKITINQEEVVSELENNTTTFQWKSNFYQALIGIQMAL